jgi:rare lipoprotein A
MAGSEKRCSRFESAEEQSLVKRFSPAEPAKRSMERGCFVIVVCLALTGLAACGARRPISGQPPPLQPVPTPEKKEEEAKRSTSVEPQPTTARRSKSSDLPAPGVYTEEGNASWYGAPFHGRKASNGETYDMNKLTAAHRTLPFESIVRVTNLNNGKSTTVRITDRGPFVDNRIIDLSYAAAKEIESVGPGVVPVRIEVLSGPDPFAGFFTVQVGAFKEKGNAERLKERLSATYSPIFIQQVLLEEGNFYRVRVGRVSGEADAKQLSQELRVRKGFSPMVLRLDDAGEP